MAEQTDLDWLSDYVISVLKSPTWVVPVQEFIDENAILFDESEENSLEHTKCHNDFKELVSNLILCHLMEVSVTEEQFESFCQTGLTKNRSLHRALAEQLLAVEDFLTFKAMMAKHNAEICRTVVREAESADPPELDLAQAVVKNSLAEGLLTSDDWEIYDAQQFGLADSIDLGEDFSAYEAEAKREEAELQQAIALSLSIEEERLRQMAANEAEIPVEDVAPPPPPVQGDMRSLPDAAWNSLHARFQAPTLAPPPTRLLETKPLQLSRKPWGFTSSPLMARPIQHEGTAPPPPPPVSETSAEPEASLPPAPPAVSTEIPRLPGQAGFISSPLCRVPAKPRVAVGNPEEEVPPPPPPPQEEQKETAPVEKFRTNLQLWKRRASNAVQPLPKQLRGARTRLWSPPGSPKSAPSEPPFPSEEERQQRAEHLKRQRDRLMAKRSKEREQQLQQFARLSNINQIDTTFSKEASAARGRRRVAELSGGPLASQAAPSRVQPESADKLRQALSRQLLQSLASSVVSDANVLDDQLHQLESMRWSAA
mmetsp:Transcript_31093/g.58321  ORF Transcript_31093/g.58321 Transcript_31093/m.58321 type:complete len:540 (+) Transcript_31093:53-1672(+)